MVIVKQELYMDEQFFDFGFTKFGIATGRLTPMYSPTKHLIPTAKM